MDPGDYDKYGSAVPRAPPLAANVDLFAGRQVNELEDDSVSLTAVGISALTAVGLSGSIDQFRRQSEESRTAIVHSWQRSWLPSTRRTPGSWVFMGNMGAKRSWWEWWSLNSRVVMWKVMSEPDSNLVLHQGSTFILRLCDVCCGCILGMCLWSNWDFKIKWFLE